MSRTVKTYGIVIRTEKGVKVMGLFQDTKPTRNEIRNCLDFERVQELKAIQTRESGWRLAKNINNEMAKVENEYRAAVKAVKQNNYLIKVLN